MIATKAPFVLVTWRLFPLCRLYSIYLSTVRTPEKAINTLYSSDLQYHNVVIEYFTENQL